MAFHVLVYSGSVGVGSTFVELAALTDGVFATSNSRYVHGSDVRWIAGYGAGTSLNSVRVSTPSLRQIAQPLLRPVSSTREPGNDPNVAELMSNPVILRGTEEIAVEAYHDNAGSQTIDVVLFVSQGMMRTPAGDIIPIKGTSSTSVTAGSWQQLTVTWSSNLPRGEYDVVGAELVSSAGVAFRLIFDGVGFRPGGLCVANQTSRTHRYFYGGMLGTWSSFRWPVMPRVEMFATGAVSSHTVYLQTVRRS